MADDWRIRIELPDEHAGGLLDRLGLELSGEAAELAAELEQKRLAVSRDDEQVFVYAASQPEAARASGLIDAVLREHGLEAKRSRIEHWLEDEERWDSDPPDETWEEDALERGYAPWEVRVELPSHREAAELADRLEAEGYPVERRWRYLIAGASSREDAEQLAERVHGEVEAGGGVVWETVPGNPFAVFGGLAGSGTPTG
jgi:outer membrane murein-binding lipoprotein Lpp